MRDEIYDREYQAGRAELHAGIDRAVLAIGRGFATIFNAIHDVQFSAPWHKVASPKVRDRAGIA